MEKYPLKAAMEKYPLKAAMEKYPLKAAESKTRRVPISSKFQIRHHHSMK
jgi:hypothetical protein